MYIYVLILFYFVVVLFVNHSIQNMSTGERSDKTDMVGVTSEFVPTRTKMVECTKCLGAAYFSLARQMGGLKPLCIGWSSTERLAVPDNVADGSSSSSGSHNTADKLGRITVDDDFHCLGLSISLPSGVGGVTGMDEAGNPIGGGAPFPVCVRGIQSITEKAIMGPEGRRLDIDYDRVAGIVGSGKAKNMGQVSAVEVVSLKWRDPEDYF